MNVVQYQNMSSVIFFTSFLECNLLCRLMKPLLVNFLGFILIFSLYFLLYSKLLICFSFISVLFMTPAEGAGDSL